MRAIFVMIKWQWLIPCATGRLLPTTVENWSWYDSLFGLMPCIDCM
jgi:hypothetical protein